MLKAEWFNLPMERELTLIKINKEIDECSDLHVLRESLKSTAHQSARFQHMLSELLKENLTAEVNEFFQHIKIEEEQAND